MSNKPIYARLLPPNSEGKSCDLRITFDEGAWTNILRASMLVSYNKDIVAFVAMRTDAHWYKSMKLGNYDKGTDSFTEDPTFKALGDVIQVNVGEYAMFLSALDPAGVVWESEAHNVMEAYGATTNNAPERKE